VIVLDMDCQDVNSRLQILRKGLNRAGAKLAMTVGPEVNFIISNRSFESATTLEQLNANVIVPNRSNRRRSAQVRFTTIDNYF
jgi:hypothetical protein